MTTTLNITDARRVAVALRVSENRLLQTARELGCTLHTINGKPFIDVDDEARIAKLLETEAKQ